MLAKTISKDTVRGFKYSPQTGMVYRTKGGKGFGVGPCLTVNNHGYRQTRINKKIYLHHRLAFVFMGKDIPVDMKVDHINGNTQDNRWDNLRLVTNQENGRNHHNHRNGRVPYVHYRPERKTWSVRKIFNGELKTFGYYKVEQEAIDRVKELGFL